MILLLMVSQRTHTIDEMTFLTFICLRRSNVKPAAEGLHNNLPKKSHCPNVQKWKMRTKKVEFKALYRT